jgi:uncharacterized Zn finger protein
VYFEWRPYVSVAKRRQQAAREVAKLRKRGRAVAPVTIEGRTIARTFWGKSWCRNLEQYSDYENRLPRGRTYVRNGSVIDLGIAAGEVSALVSGSEIYRVAVNVSPVPEARYDLICRDCAGSIDSLVELLQGRFSKGVMERLCRQGEGLFPAPKEIRFSCSCPDVASMCKHVAAVLYGVGARLDEKPDLLFTLRGADPADLIARAGADVPLSTQAPSAEKILDSGQLGEIFGIEMAEAAPPPAAEPATPRRKAAGKKKPKTRKAAPRRK